MNTLRFRFWSVLLVLFFALALQVWQVPAAEAQEEEVSALKSRISLLEQRVKELEGLLKECEELRKMTTSDKFGWQNKKNWRRLTVGMQDSQVKSILGDPSKVIQGTKTLWYYPSMYCGYVTFDQNGKVVGWNEP